VKIKISKSQWEKMGREAGWIKESALFQMVRGPDFIYRILSNRPDGFKGDVRNSVGQLICNLDNTVLEYGFMKHLHDIEGLKEYLIALKHMQKNQTVQERKV
jgi:hypothetical protein